MTSLGDFAESTIQPACPSRDIPTSRRNNNKGSALHDLGKSHHEGHQLLLQKCTSVAKVQDFIKIYLKHV
jgi:hypothetical protein